MIGSSDAPAILGVSPYAGPFDVYLDKVGDAPTKESTPEQVEAMAWGHRLEDTVARAWAEQNGHRVRRVNRIIRHRHHECLGASLDREVIGQPWIIEVKIRQNSKGWGDRGTDLIPRDVWVQVQHQMLVTAKRYAVVVVLFRGQTLRWYNIEYDEEFATGWEAMAVEWWNTYPVQRMPPPVDGSASAERFLRSLPADEDETTIATPEIEILMGDYQQALRNVEQATAHLETLKQQLMKFMDTAVEMTGPGFRIRWKPSKPAKQVGWEQIAEAYRRIVESHWAAEDEEIAAGGKTFLPVRVDLGSFVTLYTTEKKPARPWNVEFDDE